MLIVAMLSFALTSFSSALMANADNDPSKLRVVVTISPLYLIAKEVIGDKAEIHVLAPAGVDPHHYSPTPDDIVHIESCDLFICLGREEFLGTLPQPKKRTLLWSDWIKAGVYIEHDNPHYLWLYPDNAKVLARKIAEVMSELDPSNSNHYEARAREFEGDLESLKLWLKDVDEVVRGREGKGLEGRRVVLVADHFEPFAEWLGLDVTYVIIRGEGLPGPRDISSAIEKAEESTLIIVSATQSGGDEGRIARQVSEASGTPIVYLYGIPTSMDDNYVNLIKRNIIIIAAHLVEHQPKTYSSSLHPDVSILSTVVLAVIATVEAVWILRLRAK